jgi:hypothetical protein
MAELCKGRDNKIDFLRSFGTFSVILAHMGSPELLIQLRTFDVVMLVYISGMSFAYKPCLDTKKYFKKRTVQLLIPTYITIGIVFVLANLLFIALDRTPMFQIEYIIRSFLFLDGIGYIWITKLYLIIALIAPVTYRISSRIEKDLEFFCLLITFYIIYHLANALLFKDGSLFYEHYFSMIIPYGIIFSLGIRSVQVENFMKKSLIASGIGFGFIQMYEVFQGTGFSPNSAKYPPLLYYLLYGLFMGLLLYKLLPNKYSYIVKWCSINSFSIYLTHIVVLMALNFLADIAVFSFLSNWIWKYVVVISVSILFCRIVDLYSTKNKQVVACLKK